MAPTDLVVTSGVITVEQRDADLTAALASLQAGINASVQPARTISAGPGLTGGGDLSANRSFALTGQALALHNLAANGIVARTGAGTVSARALAAGAGLTVTNGDGVSGNPTFALANMAQATIKGRADGAGTGAPVDLTPTQVRTLLGIAAGATANATDAQLRDRATHTGAQAISTVTGLQAALDGKAATADGITGAERTKLAGIATGATANATDAQLRDRATHTGAQAIATVTGLQAALDGKAAVADGITGAERTKLGGIATGATANSSDAALRDRATHTGAQAISTVTGLQTALDGKATAAQGALADSAVQPAGLAPFAPRSEIAAARAEARPGDAPLHFTTAITGDETGPELIGAGITLATDVDLGAVIRVEGVETHIAARAPVALHPGRVYRARVVLRRVVNPADPLNDAVEWGVRFLTQTKTGVADGSGNRVVETLSLTVAQGVYRSEWFTFGTGQDFAIPAGAVYARPWVRTYGLDGATLVAEVEYQDATDAAAVVEVAADLAAHEGLTNNPHGTTAAQVGLGDVDNTADADKPVSTLQQAEIDRTPLRVALTGVDLRAADVPDRYTDVIAGGADTSRPLVDYQITAESQGRTFRIAVTGTHVLALRQLIPVASGEALELRVRAGSATSNPVVGGYELGLAWFNTSRVQLTGGDAETILRAIPDVGPLATVTDSVTFGRDTPFADLMAPSGARYCQPFIRLTGSAGLFLVSTLAAREADLKIAVDRMRTWIAARDTPPTGIAISSAEIDLAATIGTEVGTLALIDADPVGRAVYELLSNPGGLFSISGDRLLVAASLASSEGPRVIRVRATDWLGNTLTRDVAIEVVDGLFHPSDLAATAVIDPTDFGSMWQEVAQTNAAVVAGPVGRVNSSGGGARHFLQSIAERRPTLRLDSGGRPYLHDPGTEPGGPIDFRMASDAAVLAGSEYYIGIAVLPEGDYFAAPFLQRAGAYGDAGNVQLQLNSNWTTTGASQVLVADRATAFVQGAADGFSISPTETIGFGQPANGFCAVGQPVTLELVIRPGTGASEFLVNGVVRDRFTSTASAANTAAFIFTNAGLTRGEAVRLYGLAAINGAVTDAERRNLSRWLMRRAGAVPPALGTFDRIWSARAAAVDGATGRVLAGKNADQAASAASMAKVATALVTLRYLDLVGDLSTQITVTAGDANVSGSTANIEADDVVSIEDLLYACALPSANEAARTLQRIIGTALLEQEGELEFLVAEARARFTTEMTRETLAIPGVSANASWDSAVGGGSVTPVDMCLILKRLLDDFPVAETIFGTLTREITAGGPNPRAWTITTSNQIAVRGEDWVEAAKTGTTTIAGPCLVLAYDVDGGRVYQCGMNSVWAAYRFADQIAMRDRVLQDWVWVDGQPLARRLA